MISITATTNDKKISELTEIPSHSVFSQSMNSKMHLIFGDIWTFLDILSSPLTWKDRDWAKRFLKSFELQCSRACILHGTLF